MAHRNKSPCRLGRWQPCRYRFRDKGGGRIFRDDAGRLSRGADRGTESSKISYQSKKAEETNRISVTVPKTWMVTADLKERGVVLLIFDPKTETQAGYALDPEASKKMAAALVQNADAIQAHRHS
jgi:hypothetical protein